MVNVAPVWFLALLGIPLAAGVSYWLVNRPERHEELAPGETELEFGEREGMTFRISYEYLCEFLYGLREKFENGWSMSQVAALLNNVVDRRNAEWRASYVVTAAGTADEINLQFFQTDRHTVRCCFRVPRAFVNIVKRHVSKFPVRHL